MGRVALRRGPSFRRTRTKRHARLHHPHIPTTRRPRLHRRVHPAPLRPPSAGTPPTAHVAEDPLRASPAPLGDVGLPRLRTGPSFDPFLRGNLATSLHLHGSPPPAASLRSCRPPRYARRDHAPSRFRLAGARFAVTGFRTSPCTGVCATAGATARASGAVLRTSAVGSVSNACSPRITPSGPGAADGDADRRRADLLRASVFNSLPRANLPTTARLAAFGDVALAHAVRLAALVFGIAPPRSRRPVRTSPSPASALRHPVLSIPLSALLPEPPAACFARLPSASSALPATQSPWRLPSVGFSGTDSPSLIPWVCRS